MKIHKIWSTAAHLVYPHMEINSPHSLHIMDGKQEKQLAESDTQKREHL